MKEGLIGVGGAVLAALLYAGLRDPIQYNVIPAIMTAIYPGEVIILYSSQNVLNKLSGTADQDGDGPQEYGLPRFGLGNEFSGRMSQRYPVKQQAPTEFLISGISRDDALGFVYQSVHSGNRGSGAFFGKRALNVGKATYYGTLTGFARISDSECAVVEQWAVVGNDRDREAFPKLLEPLLASRSGGSGVVAATRTNCPSK